MEHNTTQLDSEELILLDAEAQLISIAIHSSQVFNEISLQLKADDFTKQANQIIFRVLNDLRRENRDISITQLADTLSSKKLLNNGLNINYLSELSSLYYTDEGYENYIRIIFDHSVKRQLKKVLNDMTLLLNTGKNSIQNILAEVQTKVLEIKSDLSQDSMTHISVISEEVIRHIDKLRQNKERITGVPSGYVQLDEITAGWQRGDFIILAARPSMGKTAFALNLAYNAAKEALSKPMKDDNNVDNCVAIFSLEMPKEQLVQRMFGMSGLIDSQVIRTGQVSENVSNKAAADAELMRKLAEQNEIFKKLNIVIDDSPGLTVIEIQSKLRKMKRDYGVNLCIIDYLQLISSINNNGDNRQNEISAISRQLKKIARELEMPIICLSQLSRSVEKREDKRPIMSDLRDSGAIEQDADIIIFLYREDYYNFSNENDEKNDIQKTEIIISKHRNGPTGIVNVNFNKRYGKFTDFKQ